MNNDAFVKNVGSRLIEQIRNGTAPWQKPWEPGTSFLPFNPTNGTRYKGINVVNLLSRGYGDARWMTYRQAQTKGYQVRRGEKGTQVQYWPLGSNGTMDAVKVHRPRDWASRGDDFDVKH